MFRSSIFNFESFEGFQPSLPKTLLFVVAVLALLEIAVRVTRESAPEKLSKGKVLAGLLRRLDEVLADAIDGTVIELDNGATATITKVKKGRKKHD